MRVLISAGAKTQSIIDRIESKLSSGGVDFVVVPFIEDIDDIYQRGEWFDRAVILEQSWSHDFVDTDVASMRMRINEFANQSADRGIDNISFVFLTQEEGTAAQVYEEILPIQTNSIVLVKKPKYKVSFMSELVTTELGRFTPDIVYTPKFEDEVDIQQPQQPEQVEQEPDWEINYNGGSPIDNGIYNGDGLPVDGSEPMQPGFEGEGDPFNWDDAGIPVGERPLGQSTPNWAPTAPPIPQISQIPQIFGSDPSIQTGPMPSMQEAPVQQQQTQNPGFNMDIPQSQPRQDVDFNQQSGDIGGLGFDDWSDPVQETPGFMDTPVGTSIPNPGFAEQNLGFSGEGSFEEPPVYIPNIEKRPEQSFQDQGYQEQDLGYSRPQSGEIPDYSYGEESSQDIPGSGEIPDYSQDTTGIYDEPPISGDMPDYSVGQPVDMYGGDGMYDQQGYNQYNPEMEQVYPNDGSSQGYQQPSDTDMGYGGRNVTAPLGRRGAKLDFNRNQVRSLLDAFANRGNSIVVTGCGGCGSSTVALNLATIINNLGYTVLLVDLDTKHKAQSYISKGNFDSLEADSAGLLAAINSASGINAHTAIVQTGFHLLTMGMNSEPFEINKLIQKEKIARFINLAKTSHNFVIYDIPFETAVGFGKDFTFMGDNIVITVDCSNWGITKTMLDLCNIEDEDMQETIFSRGQLLFNRYRALHKVMGRKVKTAMDITKVMDYKVRELEGDDPGLYFQQMHICGLINEDPKFEAGWYENIQYADTPAGSKIFVEILKNIVLKA